MVQIILKVTASGSGTLTNVASAPSSAVDMIPSNNTATATAVIEGVANMAITKNDDADPGNQGESNMIRSE